MKSDPISRRQLLGQASAAALITALHPPALFGQRSRLRPETAADAEPRISALRLLTAASFDSLKQFYTEGLGLPVIAETEAELTLAGGATAITFVKADPELGTPWYHVAFNIPENKLLAAREWQLERSPLVETPERLRDPRFPEDVRHFRNWNAHSLFFYDPAGNLLEYIARHDLGNRADGPFTSADILYASEIAFVVDDQPASARHLHRDLGLDVYPLDTSWWWAMGDELGLLLCIPKRLWGENTDNPKRFGVYPTEATIQGGEPTQYQLPGYPYRVTVA